MSVTDSKGEFRLQPNVAAELHDAQITVADIGYRTKASHEDIHEVLQALGLVPYPGNQA